MAVNLSWWVERIRRAFVPARGCKKRGCGRSSESGSAAAVPAGLRARLREEVDDEEEDDDDEEHNDDEEEGNSAEAFRWRLLAVDSAAEAL